MRLRIVSIGKDRSGLFEPIVQEYVGRLQRYTKTETIIAGEAQGEDAQARKAESALLRKKLGAARFVALDERGESLTSLELAARLASEARNAKELAFILGGPSGFDPELRTEAAWTLALSRFTLPHQLARAVLAEQLYRAHTLLRGEPYSK